VRFRRCRILIHSEARQGGPGLIGRAGLARDVTDEYGHGRGRAYGGIVQPRGGFVWFARVFPAVIDQIFGQIKIPEHRDMAVRGQNAVKAPPASISVLSSYSHLRSLPRATRMNIIRTRAYPRRLKLVALFAHT